MHMYKQKSYPVRMEKPHADLNTTALSIRNFMHPPLQIDIKQVDQLLSSEGINSFNCNMKNKRKENIPKFAFFFTFFSKETY